MFEGYVSRTTYNMLIRIGKIAPYANYTCLQQAGRECASEYKKTTSETA